MTRPHIWIISSLLVLGACSKKEEAPIEPIRAAPVETSPAVAAPAATPPPVPAPAATPASQEPQSTEESGIKGADTAEEAALELVRSIVRRKVEKARSLLLPLRACTLTPENEQAKCREIVNLMNERLEGFTRSAPSAFNPGSVVDLKHRGPPGVSRYLVQPVGNPSGRGPQVVVVKYEGRFYGSYPPDDRFPIQTLPTADTPTADDLKEAE